MLQDSGHRKDFGTGAVRERAPGKGRYDLLPPAALKALALIFEGGAEKYGDRNWENGLPLDVFLDSGMRHLVKLMNGETDEDHAALCMANMAMYIGTRDRIEREDDCCKDAPSGSGYLFTAPLGTSFEDGGWVQLGYTTEGVDESLFTNEAREVSMTFKLDDVSRENLDRAFNGGIKWKGYQPRHASKD